MSYVTEVDPESAVIGMKLGQALALMLVVQRAEDVPSPYDGYAQDAAKQIADVLEILGIDIS
jgi:hypothetical protein